MPSPFPGMDPFIEGQRWPDFHTTFITIVREMLMPRVRPRYVVEVEEYVYLARGEEDPDRLVEPDLASPWNKASGEGRTEYLVKRTNLLLTPAHLVELDLLRGGQRLPTREPLTPADYYAFVCRKERLPAADVYAWTLQQPLPPIPIPLAGDDPDVGLDLQTAFTTTYDRAGYDYALNYRRAVEPPLVPAVAAWAQMVLKP